MPLICNLEWTCWDYIRCRRGCTWDIFQASLCWSRYGWSVHIVRRLGHHANMGRWHRYGLQWAVWLIHLHLYSVHRRRNPGWRAPSVQHSGVKHDFWQSIVKANWIWRVLHSLQVPRIYSCDIQHHHNVLEGDLYRDLDAFVRPACFMSETKWL